MEWNAGMTSNKAALMVYDGSGSLQSLEWNGGMEWWNGIVECVLQGERSLLMQFSESDCWSPVSYR